MNFYLFAIQGWYAEFLLKIVLQILLGKIAVRLIFQIMLKSLHIGPDPSNKKGRKISEIPTKFLKTFLYKYCPYWGKTKIWNNDGQIEELNDFVRTQRR